MRDPRRVLVLDAEQPAALAIARSLGRRGVTVEVGERHAPCLCSYSRYVRRAHVYPDPLTDAAGFLEHMQRLLAAERYDLVIPVAEDTVLPLARARQLLEPATRLAIAPSAALEVMVDKAQTFALAEKLGVPIPRSWTFHTLAELEAAAPTLPYPLVVKPARSISGGGSSPRTKLNVSYAHDAAELARLAKGPVERGGAVILQEYFKGDGVGVELIADHGEVVYLFQHKRLHELPLTGGGSCLRESVAVHPALAEDARRLMRAVGWHGVAMVEMKLDPHSGEHRLMEVNGRFWGSLPLAVAAGADFPWMTLELFTAGKRPELPPAKLGVVCRKLAQDVYWYVQVLRPDQDEPLIRWPSRGEVLKDSLLLLSPRHRFDVQSLADPRPGLVDLWRTGEWFVERVQAVRRRKQAEQAQQAVRDQGRVVRDHLPRARHLLFVCYGNINRSALAERHLKSILPVSTGIEISSAGFHPQAGRPADPPMVREAASHGLDLGGWSSHTLDAAMLERADLVLVMELAHLERLRAEHPAAGEKSFLLSAVTTQGPLEISDPYGGDPAAFARCFAEITTCTRAIAGVCRGDPPRSEMPR